MLDLLKGSFLTVDLMESRSCAKRARLPVTGWVVAGAPAGVTLATLGLFSSFPMLLHQGLDALWRLLLVPVLVGLA